MSSGNPSPESGWQRTVFRRGPVLVGDYDDRPSPGGRFALLAFALLMASQTTRWGWWTDIGGNTQDVGYVGQSVAGLLGALIAFGLWFVIRAPSGATSGFRFIQGLPLLLGLACLLVAVSGYQQANAEMLTHRADERPADLDAGVWLAVIGGFSGFVGGLRATSSRLRNPTHRDAPAISVRSLLRQVGIGAVGVPAWLAIWLSAGQVGGMWLLTFGLLFAPVVSLAVVGWFHRDGLSDEERRARVEPVPMDRLHEQGRNR